MAVVEEEVEEELVQVAATPDRPWAAIVRTAVLAALFGLLIVLSAGSGQLARLGRTAFVIAIVVGLSGLLFALANVLVSQANRSWPLYRGVAGAIVAALGFGVLRGNRSVGTLVASGDYRLLSDDGTSFVVDDPELVSILSGVADPDLVEFATGALGLIEWPLVGAILGFIAGAATGVEERRIRLGVSIVVAIAAGWLIADNLLFRNRPDANLIAIVLVALLGAGIGALVSAALTDRRFFVERILLGAAVGALIAGWLMPELATGSIWAARFACIVPLSLLAAKFGWAEPRGAGGLADFDRRARALIFLGPALTFLSISLVIPAVRTIFTSFLDRESEEYVGLDNYRDLISSDAFVDTSGLTDSDGSSALLSSQLFWFGIVAIAAGVLIGASIHYSRNKVVGFERTPGSISAVLIGAFVLVFALFSLIRGTFPNTLWWMFTVTIGATLMGLVMAVLSQRAGRWESVAKSLVFMPMAISMVGASIIWRFQYRSRLASRDQTGTLNALWLELGKLSHSGWPRLLVLLCIGAILVRLGWMIFNAVRRGDSIAGTGTAVIVVGYLFVELLRRSLGGFTRDGDVIVGDTVLFLEQVRPFNNVFLMFILIWIQTGFAMVILGAAIKAVPEEFLEAARIDGASETEQFFYITIPQILPTLGVVITTIMVAVAKVFDIVKVSTGGNFGTNVLANDFFSEAFQFFDRGVGSAIAVVILLTIAPILVFNVYQMQKADA